MDLLKFKFILEAFCDESKLHSSQKTEMATLNPKRLGIKQSAPRLRPIELKLMIIFFVMNPTWIHHKKCLEKI